LHFFTFGEYSLIWGNIEKYEYFSFVLKVNKKKVGYAHIRAQNVFFEDYASKSIGTEILAFLDVCPKMSMQKM